MTVGPPSQSDIFNSYVNRALRPSPSAKGISLQVRISGCKKSYSEMKSIFQHPSNLTPKWASCLPWKLRGSQAKPHTDHQGSQQGGPTHRPDKHPCDILNIVSFFWEGLPKGKLPVGPSRTSEAALCPTFPVCCSLGAQIMYKSWNIQPWNDFNSSPNETIFLSLQVYHIAGFFPPGLVLPSPPLTFPKLLADFLLIRGFPFDAKSLVFLCSWSFLFVLLVNNLTLTERWCFLISAAGNFKRKLSSYITLHFCLLKTRKPVILKCSKLRAWRFCLFALQNSTQSWGENGKMKNQKLLLIAGRHSH